MRTVDDISPVHSRMSICYQTVKTVQLLGGSKQEMRAHMVKGLMTACHSLWFRRRISETRTFVFPSITIAGVESPPHSFSGFFILSVLSTRGASSQ